MRSASPYAEEHLEELRGCLDDLDYPDLIDRSDRPEARKSRYDQSTHATVAILSRAPRRISAIVEGGRQQPESVFLVLDHSWLERRGDQLFLHKGVWFGRGRCQAFLDRYDPPRQVTYFANYFTDRASGNERNEGKALEEGLKCPMSLSTGLESIVNDKVYQRLVLARGAVSFPVTRVFLFQGAVAYDMPKNSRLTMERFKSEGTITPAAIAASLRAFLATHHIGTFVLKGGAAGAAPYNTVVYFDAEDVVAAAERAAAMLLAGGRGTSVLVEEHLDTMPSQSMATERALPVMQAVGANGAVSLKNFTAPLLRMLSHEDTDSTDGDDTSPAAIAHEIGMDVSVTRRLAFVIRVVVARNHVAQPTASGSVCLIGPSHSPLRMSNALPHTLEETLRQWGVTDANERARISSTVYREAEHVLELIVDAENALGDIKGTLDAGSDLIAVDFVLAQQGGLVMPYVIRAHDHNSLELIQRLELSHGTLGHCVRPWIHRMLARSQQYLLRGKTVLVVGASGYGKMPTWDMLIDWWGLRLIVVDPIPDHLVRRRVHKYIQFEGLGDHGDDVENAHKIIALLKEHGIDDPEGEIDGVMTIYDPCVVVAAHVAKLLGKTGNEPLAHDIAKDKCRMAEALNAAQHKSSLLHPPRSYTGLSIRISSEQDIRDALVGPTAPMDYPCVLKATHGMCGMGAKLVRSLDDALEHYRTVEGAVESVGGDSSGSAFGDTSGYMLMEYLHGREVDVDVVMWNGAVVLATVCDNGPTKLPHMQELSAAMPTTLPNAEVEALIAGAQSVCKATGLNYGVFNAEFKYGPEGPRLIEVNSRLGGYYLLDWAQRVYNVNFLLHVVQVAVGMRPIVAEQVPRPVAYAVGIHVFANEHAKALVPLFPSIDERKLSREEQVKQNRLRKLDADGTIVYVPYVSRVTEINDEWVEPCGHIGAIGRTHKEAAIKLVTALQALGIEDCSDLPTSYLIAGFGLDPAKIALELAQ